MRRQVAWWTGSEVFWITCLAAPRRRSVWANRVGGQHETFKRSVKGRQRSAERQFVRGL